MPLKDIVDRHHPRAHDASPASMATQAIMYSPQREHHLNHRARRSEATPHWYYRDICISNE
jgi:hypothetical protein